MKKVIITLVICLVMVFSVIVLWQNPKISNQVFISFSEAFDTLTGNKQKPYNENFETNILKIDNSMFYYETLDEEQKKIYTALINGAVKLEEDILVEGYSYVDNNKLMNDISETIEALFADHPELFYIQNKYSVSTIDTLTGVKIEIKLVYDVKDMRELEERVNSIKNEIDNILSKVDATDTFNIELQIHDILANEIKYYDYESIEEIPDYCHSVYGALIQKEAVCDGFAKAFQVLLSAKNIDSIIAIGKLNTESHAWNMVNVDDAWYHVDVTSDASLKEQEDAVIHAYFNLTTEEISKTHTIYKQEILPEAKTNTYNYHYFLNKNITNENNFSGKFEEIIKENNDDKILELRAEDVSDVSDKMIRVLQTYKYPEYLLSRDIKFNYYNVLNTYILFKK